MYEHLVLLALCYRGGRRIDAYVTLDMWVHKIGPSEKRRHMRSVRSSAN
jgi:hypothetical protein